MRNYTHYFAIEKQIHNKGINLNREDLIYQFTEGKKSGLRELNATEYKEFIDWLNRSFISERSQEDWTVRPGQYQRRKIIALLCKIGFIKNGRADMARIYTWVYKYGYLHKSLNEYTQNELPRLVSQTEAFYKSHIERL